jgi:hypothetical protein
MGGTMHDDDSTVQPKRSERAPPPTTVRAKWERPALVRLMANEALGGDVSVGDAENNGSNDDS